MVRIPVFIGLAIVPGEHVPVTHQDQGYGTVREDPFPAPGSSEPQKTVGTRSCPIGWPSSSIGMTVEQIPGLRPCRPRHTFSGSRPRRTRLVMPVPRSALPCPPAFRRGKAGIQSSSSEARLTSCRIGDGGVNQADGSKPVPFPGSPPPSSINRHLIQKPWSYRTPRPP